MQGRGSPANVVNRDVYLRGRTRKGTAPLMARHVHLLPRFSLMKSRQGKQQGAGDRTLRRFNFSNERCGSGESDAPRLRFLPIESDICERVSIRRYSRCREGLSFWLPRYSLVSGFVVDTGLSDWRLGQCMRICCDLGKMM